MGFFLYSLPCLGMMNLYLLIYCLILSVPAYDQYVLEYILIIGKIIGYSCFSYYKCKEIAMDVINNFNTWSYAL